MKTINILMIIAFVILVLFAIAILLHAEFFVVAGLFIVLLGVVTSGVIVTLITIR